MAQPQFDPVKPGEFVKEKVDLDTLIYEGDPDAIHDWVETTITRHRAQAYAHGVEAGKPRSRTDWGDLFPYIPLVLVCLLLVLGVL